MGGFLAVIGAIISIGAICMSDYDKSCTTCTNEEEARKNNKPYYYDGNNKLRATSTGEQCITQFCDGFNRVVGLKTHREYWNSLTDRNKKLKEAGKPFIYKQYFKPGFPKSLDIKEAWKYDVEKKLPFKTSICCGSIFIRYYDPSDLTKEVDKVILNNTPENYGTWM